MPDGLRSFAAVAGPPSPNVVPPPANVEINNWAFDTAGKNSKMNMDDLAAFTKCKKESKNLVFSFTVRYVLSGFDGGV